MLRHLVITRFSVNTKLSGRLQVRDNDERYLRYRLRLFELFCLPSMQSQICQDFKWFVLFGGNTPQWLRDRLDEWERGGAFIPLYSSNFSEALEHIKIWAGINMSCGDMLLTTRLDNDDSLSCTLLKAIQARVDESLDMQYLCPVRGHQVVVKSDNPEDWRYYSLRYPANPFVSLAERITKEPPVTVYHRKHGSIRSNAIGEAVVNMMQYPSWLQVLHGKNVGNRLWSRRMAKPDLTAFPFLESYYRNGLPAGLRSLS